jgi:hypothetical protein
VESFCWPTSPRLGCFVHFYNCSYRSNTKCYWREQMASPQHTPPRGFSSSSCCFSWWILSSSGPMI